MQPNHHLGGTDSPAVALADDTLSASLGPRLRQCRRTCTGRDATITSRSEIWIQTLHPAYPLLEALKRHDFPAFAAQQLKEREQANLPPFSFLALVRAVVRMQEATQGFLNAASAAAAEQLADLRGFDPITLYPAVPISIQRIANVERTQMLVESP